MTQRHSLSAQATPLLIGMAAFVTFALLSMYTAWNTIGALSVIAGVISLIGLYVAIQAFDSNSTASIRLGRRASVLAFSLSFAAVSALWAVFLCRWGFTLWSVPSGLLVLVGLLWSCAAFGDDKKQAGIESLGTLMGAMGELMDPEGGGKKLAELFNHMTEVGAEQFAQILNRASTTQVEQLATWLGSTDSSDVTECAEMLNARKVFDMGGLLQELEKQRSQTQLQAGAAKVTCGTSNLVSRQLRDLLLIIGGRVEQLGSNRSETRQCHSCGKDVAVFGNRSRPG